MTFVGKLRNRLSQSFTVLRRYRYRWVLIIALTWTALDLLLWAIRASVPQADAFADESRTRSLNYVLLRSAVVFHVLRRFPDWAAWLPRHAPKLVARTGERSESIGGRRAG